MKHSEETKRKISESLKKHKRTDDHIRNLKGINKGGKCATAKAFSITKISTNTRYDFETIIEAYHFLVEQEKVPCTERQFNRYLIPIANNERPVRTTCEKLKDYTARYK